MKDKENDVVILTQYYYPEKITSAIYPHQTAHFLTSLGFSVQVICGYPKEYKFDDVDDEGQDQGVDVNRINYFQCNRARFVGRLLNYLSFILAMLFQLPKIGKSRIAIVYSTPPIFPIIGLLARLFHQTKLIFICYDLYPEIAIKTNKILPHGLIAKFMNFLNHLTFKNSDVIVTLSTEMSDFVIKNRDVNPNKVAIIENWAIEDHSVPHISESEITNITYLGNLGIAQDIKAIKEMISSPDLLNNSKFMFNFAGHGSEKEKLELWANENNIKNITFYNYLTGSDFDELIQKTDITLLTLKNELLGLAVPSKFYTYFCLGRPIIAVINQEMDIAKYIRRYNLGFTTDSKHITAVVDYIKQVSINKHKIPYNKSIYELNHGKDVQLSKYGQVIQRLLIKE